MMDRATNAALNIWGKRSRKDHKYHARKMEVDGKIFDSQLEGKRYIALKILQRQGIISDLRTQVKYPLLCNGMHICDYIADFVYIRDGVEVIEDAKGVITAEFRLKRKLMLAHGFEIELFPDRKKKGSQKRWRELK